MVGKQLPLRKCVACNEMKPKDELIRLVRADNNVEIDRSLKKDGRGAYVCRNVKCVDFAAKKKSFNRALKCPVKEEVIKEIYMELENGN